MGTHIKYVYNSETTTQKEILTRARGRHSTVGLQNRVALTWT